MLGINIFIVEDDKVLANELKDYLTRYGYTITLVHDFSNVLSEYLHVNPDLVLMDINLPFYDGFFGVHKLENIPKFR